MIMKKCKRKHHSDESSEVSSDEKYIAYVKKSSKKSSSTKDKKRAKESTSSSAHAADSQSEDSVSVKKSKKSKKKGNVKQELECNDEVFNAAVHIVAKPQINKAAVELNASIKAKEVYPADARKNQESPDSASRKPQLIMPLVDVAPKIEIMPDNDDNNDNHNDDSLEIELSAADLSAWEIDHLNMESIIVEANLKKSTKSYAPEIFKDCTSTNDFNDHKKKSIVHTNKPKEKAKRTVDSDKQEQDNNCVKVQKKVSNNTKDMLDGPSLSNIPQALQEFYDKMTRNFEQLTREHSKSDKKRRKKVINKNDLIDVVQRNTCLQESSGRPTKQKAQFFSLESKVILILEPQSQLSFLGKLKLQVLYGAVKLYGSVFYSQNTAKPIEIYSPRGYSSIDISTYSLDKKEVYDKEVLWDALTSIGVDRSLKTKLHDAISECKDEWCVLLLENFENVLTNFLSNHCKFKLFPKIENTKYLWCEPKRAECVLQSNFQFSKSSDEISICPQWNSELTKHLLNQWNSKKSLRVMVTGGKGVGKSTTARYLINHLLSHSKKVVLLDLDPGQAEMTPAACVSLNVVEEPLLGPNFTHLKMPLYQFYLEDVCVVNCLTRYMDCIKKLVECYDSRKELHRYPLIINTMGFCRGIGHDICLYLIKLIQPSNVIQIQSKRPKNNFTYALLQQTVNECKTFLTPISGASQVLKNICNYELHCVTSMAEGKRQFETWNIEPRQQRDLVLLSYISQIIKNADDKNFCNVASNNINNIVPYELPFSSFYITLVKSSTAPSHILAAMNGNIVALCGIDLDDKTSEEQRASLKYPMVVIKPPPCTCYGYGIVRGVDMTRRRLYLNTPLGEQELRHVNFLMGCSPLPFALLDSVNTSSSKYHQSTAPYAGDRGELPTSREARRCYFRNQRKNV